jgi:hypothetical protein
VVTQLSVEDRVQVEQGLGRLAKACTTLTMPVMVIVVGLLFDHSLACGVVVLLTGAVLV